MIILLSLMALCIPLLGQNVTVSEKTGSMICSQTSYAGQVTETGFAAGGFATWKHFQLPLTMTTYSRPHKSYFKRTVGYPRK